MEKSVAILLATYNSEKFIREQLDSLLNQSYGSITVTVSDDSSTDDTVSIIDEYSKKLGNITRIQSPAPLRSAQANFWFLLKNAPEADLYAFCDHDDVWLPDKIKKTVQALADIDDATPALAHSDLFVVDGTLNVLSRSLFATQRLTKRPSLEEALIQNNVTGCTTIINGALRTLALKKTDAENMIMHDWYLNILALATGEVRFVDEPLIYYRQHGNNEVGAKDAGSLSYILKRAASFRRNKESLESTYAQAEDILNVFGGELKESIDTVRVFASLKNSSKSKKLSLCRKHGFWKNTPLRRLGQILFM